MQHGTIRIECSETGRRVWIEGHEVTHLIQTFIASEKAEVMPDTLPGMTPFLAGAYGNDEDVWGVLGLHGLVESAVFLQASR